MSRLDKHRPPHLCLDGSDVFITAKTYGDFPYLASKKIKDYFWKLLEEKAKKFDIKLDSRVVLDNHYHLIVTIGWGSLIPKFVKEIHGASARYIKKSLPDLVTESGQVLSKEVTPWDERQEKRLKKLLGIAHFSSRSDNRRLKSASPDPVGIANFSSRSSIGSERDNRRLKSAIPVSCRKAVDYGRITDPEILLALLSKDRPVWYQYFDYTIRDEKDYYRHLNYIHQNPVKHRLVRKMPEYKWSSIHKFIKENGKEWIVDCFREYPIIDFQPEGIVE